MLPVPKLGDLLACSAHPCWYWRFDWFVLRILPCTEDVPRLYCTSLIVLKMCLHHTAHPPLYWRCASFVLHILIVLKMCLHHTAHSCLYWWCAWFALHILACTDDVPDSYCASPLVLKMCLVCTAHPWLASIILHILPCTEDVPRLYCTSWLYWRCASIILHILACTDDVPDSHCTFLLVLMMCLIRIAHPHLYCSSLLVLHSLYRMLTKAIELQAS